MHEYSSNYLYKLGICKDIKTDDGIVDDYLLSRHLEECTDQKEATEVYQQLVTKHPIDLIKSEEIVGELILNHILCLNQCTIEFNKRS